MVVRSTIAGIAGILMMVAAGTNPASAQGACPVGCDGATNWSGLWLGAGIGMNADMIGHNYKNFSAQTGGTMTGYGDDNSRGADGFFGSVGVGYDWHVRDRWVLGAFTDLDFGNSTHTETDYSGTGGPYGWNIERNMTWTVGARIGLLTSNTSMVYGLVGYSRTDMDIDVFENDGAGNSFRVSRNVDFGGLVVGAGLEQDLGNGFFLKGEYRYTMFGDESYGARIMNLAGNSFEQDAFELDSHSFRLGLSYKFTRGGDMIEEVSYKDIPPAPSYTAPYK